MNEDSFVISHPVMLPVVHQVLKKSLAERKMFLCCISLTALLCGKARLLQIDFFRIEITRKFCKQIHDIFFQKCIFSLSLVFVSVIQ